MNTPQIQATVNEKLPFWMDLDTGDASELTFTNTFIDGNPGILPQNRHASFAGGTGVNFGTLPEIDIGPFKFFNLFAFAIISLSGITSQEVMQGLVRY